jgi:hypothetical protein
MVVDARMSWADVFRLGTLSSGSVGSEADGCSDEGVGRRGFICTRVSAFVGIRTGFAEVGVVALSRDRLWERADRVGGDGKLGFRALFVKLSFSFSLKSCCCWFGTRANERGTIIMVAAMGGDGRCSMKGAAGSAIQVDLCAIRNPSNMPAHGRVKVRWTMDRSVEPGQTLEMVGARDGSDGDVMR